MNGSDFSANDTRFRAADLLKQAMIQDLAVAPDGSCVVYSRSVIEDGKVCKRLWRVPFEGGEASALTTTAGCDGQPRFSPDERSLLFLSDRSGKNQPWVLPLAGGEARRLAEFDGDVRAAEWSPDGSRVLVIAPSGEERYIVGDAKDPVARRITDFNWRMDGVGILDQHASVYVVPAEGGEPVRLTDPGYNVYQACWSPDGLRIGVIADRDPDAEIRVFGGGSKLWSIPSEKSDTEPQEIASLPGAVVSARWSEAGLAAIGVGIARTPSCALRNLYVFDNGKARQLGPELDRPIVNTTFGDLIDPASEISFAWSDDDSIVSLVADQGCAHPYRFGTDGSVERLTDGEIVCTAIATGGGKIAVVATDRGKPGEVYAVENGALRQLTTNGSDWLEPFRKDPVRIRVPHPDGHTVDAWFVEGRDAPKPGPLAIQIHGGPHGSHGPTPWLEMLALADAGIHVIYPNPRGSTGYGEEFARAIHGCWGGPDGSDNLRVIDWAIEEGIADPNRVGVFGLSGGGYMTLWLLGHFPGRFAAGIAENPVSDLVAMFGGSDLPTYFDERFVGVGKVPENVDAFLRHSPYMHIHRNEAPLLLLVSENDMRCPPVQSELPFAILRSRGRTVEMVRYPGEPHYMVAVGRPDRRVDRMERIVDWFNKRL